MLLNIMQYGRRVPVVISFLPLYSSHWELYNYTFLSVHCMGVINTGIGNFFFLSMISAIIEFYHQNLSFSKYNLTEDVIEYYYCSWYLIDR